MVRKCVRFSIRGSTNKHDEIAIVCIEVSTDCEMCAVILFLIARNIRLIEIHKQISEVYGSALMSDKIVRKWVKLFIRGSTNKHDELAIFCIEFPCNWEILAIIPR